MGTLGKLEPWLRGPLTTALDAAQPGHLPGGPTIASVGEDSPELPLVGRVARVTVPIPAGGPGEVVLSIRGGTERFAAWCDEVVTAHLSSP
ncbi:MAG TPA: hypothetical protein VMF65_24610 [Acidimicrobiales bacterium]|nr:hypothetical protein [Acidimicrobiales bacterium]HUB69524.1 hypothetical protein [Acidimicrobiales bacterium]